MPPTNTPEKTKEEKTAKAPSKGLQIALVVLAAVILATTAGLLADAIHTKYVTYQALGSFVQTVEEDAVPKAKQQGNLGNYDVKSVNNTLADNGDGTYTLNVELEFTNFGAKGKAFNEVIDLDAYQNDVQIKEKIDLEGGDEADIRVRNGKKTKVVKQYVVEKSDVDVKVEMEAGNYSFIYTVKLSKAKK